MLCLFKIFIKDGSTTFELHFHRAAGCDFFFNVERVLTICNWWFATGAELYWSREFLCFIVMLNSGTLYVCYVLL